MVILMDTAGFHQHWIFMGYLNWADWMGVQDWPWINHGQTCGISHNQFVYSCFLNMFFRVKMLHTRGYVREKTLYMN